jgi:hypothetical protein
MAKRDAKTGPQKFGVAHMDNLTSNVVEVDHLLSLHPALSSRKPGRKHNVEVINKSCVVLLCACWEAYVEDLAVAALEEMINVGGSHSIFPPKVLERVASTVQGPKAWDLAGDGWRQVMKDNLQTVLAKTIQALNSPKTINVDDLFSKTIGLDGISKSWKWRGMRAESASAKLDALVRLRGDIAHRVAGAHSVTLNEARAARELVFTLATLSNNAVAKHLYFHLGGDKWFDTSPWPWTRYGSTS